MDKMTFFTLVFVWLCVLFMPLNFELLNILAACGLGWIFGWNLKNIIEMFKA